MRCLLSSDTLVDVRRDGGAAVIVLVPFGSLGAVCCGHFGRKRMCDANRWAFSHFFWNNF